MNCLDCGFGPGFCVHPSLDSIIGSIGQSGRYIWFQWEGREPPKALLLLIKEGFVIYKCSHMKMHDYVLVKGKTIDDLIDFKTRYKQLRNEAPVQPLLVYQLDGT